MRAPMATQTRTWPMTPRRLLAAATDWAGDRIARWVDRTLSWIDAGGRPPPRALPERERSRAPAASVEPTRVVPVEPEPAPVADPPASPAVDVRAWIRALEQTASSELDAVDVHRTRVACRRLRTFVRDLERAGFAPAREANRALRRCSRAVAELRECDAQLERVHALAADHPEVAATLERRLVKRRASALPASRRARDRLRLGELARELHLAVDALEQAPPAVQIDAVFAARLDAWIASIPSDVVAEQLEVLHRIRVRAKQVRYSARWIGPLAPASVTRWRKLAKRAQRTIGEHREAALLHEVLVRRHARAHEHGRHADVAALGDAIATSRRACAALFAPIPGLLADIRARAAAQ
jgi:CHAD domain-containing protein